MKKFESLGRSLNAGEMKRIVGGIYDFPERVNCLIGWRLDPNVGCFCDFYGVSSPDSVTCDVSCPATMCTSGSIDLSCPYFN
ncbi:MAG: hypothetical protein JWP69_1360 [Flaviaesturariibacter sp.]|nr:hypothetical protein [Flaviaesturariibacter sp.]